MNKYLKILALSGGILTSIAPTAIKVGNRTNNDFNTMYENVERIQNILPRLSKINYRLNINSEQDQTTMLSETDELDNEVDIGKEETINYLAETLNQVTSEYEQLRQSLNTAIKDSMEYLDKYKNGEIELTNEQKIYIKEHTNSIKYLAETLEDLSEDIMCAIDGCEDCEDCDFDETANRYISTIKDLELCIDSLQTSLNSLQFITSLSNPYFYAGYNYIPNHITYRLRHSTPNNDNDDTINNDNIDSDNLENQTMQDNSNDMDSTDNALEDTTNKATDETTTTDNADNSDNSENNDTNIEDTEQTDNIDDNSSVKQAKPTTFGLKSNIDTYAPTRRNIDTFFNTALYDNEYGYGGGYGMPYGYGMQYGGGYNMNYGGYGNPYAMNGYNSNLINRETLKKVDNPVNANLNTTPDTEVDNHETKNETSKPKKIRAKRAKNIDTYTGTTIQSNVNSMGESKLSSFLKEKITNIRNKIRNKKQSRYNKDVENLENKIDETVADETSIKNVDTYKEETENVNADTNNSVDSIDDTSKTTNNITSNNEQPELHSEQPIIAQ